MNTVSVKNFVVKYKIPIIITVTAAATVAVMKKSHGISAHETALFEYVTERGLRNDFIEFVSNNI